MASAVESTRETLRFLAWRRNQLISVRHGVRGVDHRSKRDAVDRAADKRRRVGIRSSIPIDCGIAAASSRCFDFGSLSAGVRCRSIHSSRSTDQKPSRPSRCTGIFFAATRRRRRLSGIPRYSRAWRNESSRPLWLTVLKRHSPQPAPLVAGVSSPQRRHALTYRWAFVRCFATRSGRRDCPHHLDPQFPLLVTSRAPS